MDITNEKIAIKPYEVDSRLSKFLLMIYMGRNQNPIAIYRKNVNVGHAEYNIIRAFKKATGNRNTGVVDGLNLKFGEEVMYVGQTVFPADVRATLYRTVSHRYLDLSTLPSDLTLRNYVERDPDLANKNFVRTNYIPITAINVF